MFINQQTVSPWHHATNNSHLREENCIALLMSLTSTQLKHPGLSAIFGYSQAVMSVVYAPTVNVSFNPNVSICVIPARDLCCIIPFFSFPNCLCSQSFNEGDPYTIHISSQMCLKKQIYSTVHGKNSDIGGLTTYLVTNIWSQYD